jgi:hypothetical protein
MIEWWIAVLWWPLGLVLWTRYQNRATFVSSERNDLSEHDGAYFYVALGLLLLAALALALLGYEWRYKISGVVTLFAFVCDVRFGFVSYFYRISRLTQS